MIRRASRAAALALASLSCSAAPGAPSSPRPPEFPAQGQAKCGVKKNVDKPLIVEWPSADRGELETRALNHGVVLVHYSGCEMQVLSGCETTFRYSYAPMIRKRDRIVIRDTDSLYANLPIGAARLEAKLDQAGELSVNMTMVGRWEARHRVREDDLQGDCEGATHAVSALTVGSFTFSSGSDVNAAGEANVLGVAKLGGRSASTREILNADGDETACSKSPSADRTPPEGCGALLRLDWASRSARRWTGSSSGGLIPASDLVLASCSPTRGRDPQPRAVADHG